MVKIFNCNIYAKKSYGTLSTGAIFLGQPCTKTHVQKNTCKNKYATFVEFLLHHNLRNIFVVNVHLRNTFLLI